MLRRRRIGHHGSEACDHSEMTVFDLSRAEKCTAKRECTLQGILSTSNVVGLIASFLISYDDTISNSPKNSQCNIRTRAYNKALSTRGLLVEGFFHSWSRL